MKQFITEAQRMQKLAGIIAENHEETIDEGFKNWLIGLGLTAATIFGGVKVYQLDQKQQADKKAQIVYFEKNILPVFNKMDDTQKLALGAQINKGTGKFTLSSNSSITPDEFFKMSIDYAEKYMKARPNEFSIGEDSLIYWNRAKENPYE
jgi:hypothetical protein